MAIISFKHKGLERFFESSDKSGIRPDHEKKLSVQLSALKRASTPADMNVPSWRLHLLSGNLKGHYAITVNGNWRLTFRFIGDGNVELVDYQDYH